ncbi:MAG TPA: hypothetical protein VJZ00_18155 [Thermoanaerobaculia bacterium]|nr:hypothetical protein [Thermoanaerobaculia bacterium]
MRQLTNAMLFLLFFTTAMHAEVVVTVKIDSPVMRARYQPKTKDVELAIATELATRLPMYFRHWRYVARDATSNDFALNFEIAREAGNHTFALTLQTPAEIAQTFSSEIWIKAGELDARGGFPDSKAAGKRIADAIAKMFLAKNQDAIAKRLREKVPVAMKAQWEKVLFRREEPRLVVPLAWPASRVHVNSTFLVKCNWPGKGLAELETRALNEPAVYKDDQSTFDALTLQPLRRFFGDEKVAVRSVASEVRKLEPLFVYLETDDAMGLAVAEVR